MNISGNKILITGGSTGIGLALADAFLKAGNQVVIGGRRKDKLDEASRSLPGVMTIQADLATSEGRSVAIAQSLDYLPGLNIVANNAGIMQSIDLNESNPADLEKWLREEVETLKGLERDLLEIKVGQSKILAMLSRISPSLAYLIINQKGCASPLPPFQRGDGRGKE